MPFRHRILAKILAPSRWLHGLLNLLATFIALEVSESIFVRNQSNYVYPADGDSIGIPLMGIMLLTWLTGPGPAQVISATLKTE